LVEQRVEHISVSRLVSEKSIPQPEKNIVRISL